MKRIALSSLLAMLPALASLAFPFASPEKLSTDGGSNPVKCDSAYAGALVGDLNGDGLDDLAVTSIRGVFTVFLRVKPKKPGADPVYRKATDLPSEALPPKLQNW